MQTQIFPGTVHLVLSFRGNEKKKLPYPPNSHNELEKMAEQQTGIKGATWEFWYSLPYEQSKRQDIFNDNLLKRAYEKAIGNIDIIVSYEQSSIPYLETWIQINGDNITEFTLSAPQNFQDFKSKIVSQVPIFQNKDFTIEAQ